METGVMALNATMPALEARGSGYVARGAGADRVPISCRFSPCDLPIDVATTVAPNLGRTQENLRPTSPNGGSGRLYFVTMVLPVTPSSRSNSTLDPHVEPPSGELNPFSGEEAPRIGALGSSSLVPRMEPKKNGKTPFLDIRLMRLVGKGNFGKLYYGLWMGSPVAVKIIANKREQINRIEPIFEATLSTSVVHPNIVQTVKYATRRREDGIEEEMSRHLFETWVVQDWCDLGTLETHCKIPRTSEKYLPEVVDICRDISSAGSFLHSRGVLHGDLTAHNVLIKTHMSQKGYICKICDFGLARMLEGSSVDFMTSTMSTVTHMPPEHFEIGKEVKLTAKADVYAAGVLLWQTLCGKSPFAGLSPSQVVVAVVNGQRLALPEETPAEIRLVFNRCTASDPRTRPSFDELVETFSAVLSNEFGSDPGGS